MPYDWVGGFTYCPRCKKVCDSLKIELHQGWVSEYIQVICPTCKKTIWVADLTTNEEEYPDANGMKYIVKNDLTCSVCRKKTNRFDCACMSTSFGKDKKMKKKVYCSPKCSKVLDKELEEAEKKEQKKNDKLRKVRPAAKRK